MKIHSSENAALQVIAGVDLGGSKVAITLANAQGLLIKLQEAVTLQGASDAIGQQIVRMMGAACAQRGVEVAQVRALGVSTCSPFVNYQSGDRTFRAIVAPNLCGGLACHASTTKGAAHEAHQPLLLNDWASIRLEEFLAARFSQMVMENDCVAILAAERWLGAAQGVDNCVYATWSSGIGFGLCVDGKVLRGKQGNAGHASHGYLTLNRGEPCGCGNVGDIESVIGGQALARRYGAPTAQLFADAQAQEKNDSILQDARRNAMHNPTHDAATSLPKSTRARFLVMEAVEWFASTLYNLCVTLDTELFVIGGSVFLNHADYLLPQLQAHMNAKLPALTQGVRIKATALGEHAGDIGALALVMPQAWQAHWLMHWQARGTHLAKHFDYNQSSHSI